MFLRVLTNQMYVLTKFHDRTTTERALYEEILRYIVLAKGLQCTSFRTKRCFKIQNMVLKHDMVKPICAELVQARMITAVSR